MACGRSHAWLRSAPASHAFHDLKWFLAASFLVLVSVLGAAVVYEGVHDDGFDLHPRRWGYTLGGGIVSLLVIGLAVAALRRRVGEVQAGEARFRNLLESAPDAIVITSRNGHITLANSQAERLFGYTREEIDARPLAELLHKEVREADPNSCVIDMSIVRPSPCRQPTPEYIGRRKDGREVAVEVTSSPLETREGFLIINVIRDITERKKSDWRRTARYAARRVLAEARDLNAAAPAVLQAVCHYLGWDGGILWAADSAGKVLYQSAAWSAADQGLPSGLAAEFFPRAAGLPGDVWTGGEMRWYGDVRRAGKCRRSAVLAGAGYQGALGYPVLADGVVVGVFELFTRSSEPPCENALETLGNIATQLGHFVQRQHAEQAVRHSEARKSAILQAALDAIITFDQQATILEFNPAAVAIFGHATRDAVGRNLADLVLPAETLVAFRTSLAHGFTKGQGPLLGKQVEMTAVRADGSSVPVEFAVTRIDQEPVNLFTCFIRDISERKRAEEGLRRSEEKFRQLQKMEAIGTLAGGVAHDFNNLLTVVLGFADQVLATRPADEATRLGLEMIRKSAERGAALTRQLLAFSRKQVSRPVVLDVRKVVTEMKDMIQRLLGEDITVTTAFASDVPSVMADPVQIEQVLMNLTANARDAMPRGGKLHIEMTAGSLGSEDSRFRAEKGTPDTSSKPSASCNRGSHVLLTVSDTGCGMSAAVKAHLFEPFFTTKEVGKGTGLGLSTVYGIVTQNGGHIEVDSELNRGTTFRIYLPTASEPVRSMLLTDSEALRVQPVASPHAIAPSTKATILLVEDEERVRLLARHILQQCGYTILEARHGLEALQVWERAKEDVRLIVTDMVMPEMNGSDLARKLLSQRPDLKVLFMSGYTDRDLFCSELLEQGAAFLQKPFMPQALSTKVHELLCA